jgi:hypothetical protein
MGVVATNGLGVFDSGTGKRLLTFQIPTFIFTNILIGKP